MKIIIKYHNKNIEKIKKIENGDWIDLRAAETVSLKKGDYALISLGISVQLPSGYEAHIAPRSSTFKNFGIFQTNSVGVVDESYCGDGDIWKMPVYAVRDTQINENDRICQFRILKKMENIQIEETDFLSGNNRGGFGTTGKN
jgi:dUTP pyrophosphatase